MSLPLELRQKIFKINTDDAHNIKWNIVNHMLFFSTIKYLLNPSHLLDNSISNYHNISSRNFRFAENYHRMLMFSPNPLNIPTPIPMTISLSNRNAMRQISFNLENSFSLMWNQLDQTMFEDEGYSSTPETLF